MTDNDTPENISDNNYSISIAGIVTVSISLLLCLFMIIIYIINYIQIKSGIYQKEGNEDRESEALLSTGAEIENNNNTKKKKKIGLGSNYMLFLILTNFIGGINELTLFILNLKNGLKENDNICKVLGISHNFFDLCGVCWITMITFLFYCSTKNTHEIFFKETKYLIIGFVYSFSISLIISVCPLINNYYTSENRLCFYNKSLDNNFIIFWNICNASIIGINCIFNCFCLFKTFNYYSEKLKLLKNNQKQYKQLLLYIWIFRVFPLVLIVTGLLKVSSRIINIFKISQMFDLILGFSNSIAHNLNGAFNSMACIFFFKGVFMSCFNKNNKDNTQKEPESIELK